MCGVLIEEKDEKKLRDIGVKDSKLLSPLQRKALSSKIKKIAKQIITIKVDPKEIDKAVSSKKTNLNWLEADKSIEIINKSKPDKAILDCPSNNIKKYSDYIKDKLKVKTTLISEHKADYKYPVVAAASIIAKTTRDAEIEKIKKTIKQDFGSGYPSDPTTIKFLKANYSKYPFFRKSWASWKTAAKTKGQKKLEEF